GALENDVVVEPRLLEANRGADAGEAAPDDRDVHVLSHDQGCLPRGDGRGTYTTVTFLSHGARQITPDASRRAARAAAGRDARPRRRTRLPRRTDRGRRPGRRRDAADRLQAVHRPLRPGGGADRPRGGPRDLAA